MLFSHWNGRVSARTQRYRLDAGGQALRHGCRPGPDEGRRGRAAERRDRCWRGAVAGWKRDVLGELPAKDDRPFPVGHREFPATSLPARDGVPHGNVQRSARAPNCSFFTNWTTPDDRMTWDVEVATAGRYEAVVITPARPRTSARRSS